MNEFLYFLLLVIFGAILFVLNSARIRRMEERVETAVRGVGRIESELATWGEGLRDERRTLEEEVRRLLSSRDEKEQERFESLRGGLAGASTDDLARRLADHLRTVEWSAEGPSDEEVAASQELVRSRLEEIASSLGELRSNLTAVRSAAESSQAELERGARERDAERDAELESRHDLERLVLEHLEAAEFERIRLLDVPETRSSEETVRLRVEAMRRDTSWKGHVSVRGSQVVDVSLQPSYSMFP